MDWSTKAGDPISSEEWKTVRPKNVTAYCGCKCLEITQDGWGVLDLCNIHEEKIKKGKMIRIPKMKIEIDPSIFQKLRGKLRR